MEEDPLLPALHPNPNPNSNPSPSPNPHLRPSKSSAFKREERRRRKERKKQEKLAAELSQWDPLCSRSRPSDRPDPTVSDTPWPCDPAPSPPANPDPTDWAPLAPIPPPAAPPEPSAEDKSRIAAAESQARAIKTCRAFFSKKQEGEEMCTDEEDGEEKEPMIAKFFKDLFENDGDLRGYYENKREKGGDFVCLVCEKRFVSYDGLVQHASTVSRKRWVHRAYGVAVSRALGLETCQIHSIDSNKASPDSDGDLVEFAMDHMET